MADLATLYKSPEGYTAFMAWYDAALETLPVPYESLMVDTRFGATHLLAAGPADAPPVLLIHGLGGCAPLWKSQLAALAPHYRAYAVDAIGQPGKSAPVRPSYRGPAYAEWLVDALDALGVERASVVGVSMGGRLAIKLGAFAPARVDKAVLMSAIGVKLQSLSFIMRVLPFGLNLRSPSEATIRALLRAVLTKSKRPLDPEWEDGLFLAVKHFRFASGYREVRDGMTLFYPLPADELRRLTAPTLLLMGEDETLFNPHAVVARARAIFPNLVHAEIISAAGHGIPNDQPEVVNARLLDFLGRPDTKG